MEITQLLIAVLFFLVYKTLINIYNVISNFFYDMEDFKLPKKYFLGHSHTERSNFRLKDCINKVNTLINRVNEAGLSGLCITDHETLSAHVEAIQYVKKQKEDKKLPKDFKLGLGDEIYLVDKNTLELKENNEKIRYFHFLLIAKNKHGYEALKKISSRAWENSYFYRGLERTPTYKDELEEIMKDYKGDIIATSACIGSEFARTVIDYATTNNIESKRYIHQLIMWYKKVFGDDFHIEIHPSNNEEQIIYNKMALKIAKGYNIKPTIATDAHYLDKNQAKIHEIYLKADEGEREVAEFYSSTYVMSPDEVKSFLPYLTEEEIDELFQTTLNIMDSIEDYDLKHETIVPKIEIPDFKLKHIFKDYYDKYEYIRKYANSPNKEDRYHLYQIELGFIKAKQKFNEENISRLNDEYKELWLTSEKLNQPISSYYLLVQKIVNIMWKVSLVGVSRGSAGSFYTVYLLGITQINPIKYKLPYWRHLTHERPELPKQYWALIVNRANGCAA